jgi:hypothetical protein
MRRPDAGTLSRRRLLRGAFAALIAGFAVAVPWLARVPRRASLDALVRSRASAERIGRRYLAMLPADTDRATLLALSPALDRALGVVGRRPKAAARLLQQGISEDFRLADTVVVDGWVLAATEARLCAFIALA